MKHWGMVLPVLALCGCLDADITMDFKSEEQVDLAMDLRMGRQFYDMVGGDICEGGTEEIGADTVTCQVNKVMTVPELIAQADGPSQSPLDKSGVERLENGHLRVSFDLADMQSAGGPTDGFAPDMIRAAVAGHSLTLTLRAPEIITTTGDLNDDRTEARRIVPLVRLIDDQPIEPFVTELALERSCFLWVFCG